RLRLFGSDAIRPDERHDVRRGVSLHDATPMVATVEQWCGRRFASDCCRIEQGFRAHQCHAARAFRKPLIPADAGSEHAELGAPDLEARITRCEVEFLLITGAIRDMRLAITAH